jgi:hypothetical protein
MCSEPSLWTFLQEDYCTTCAVSSLVNARVQRFLADVYVSLQAPNLAGVQPRQRWIVLRMWLVSSVTAVAVRPFFCFVMAATGVIIGAASPQLCLNKVPDGQWYCQHCVPSDPPPTQHIPRRQRGGEPMAFGLRLVRRFFHCFFQCIAS